MNIRKFYDHQILEIVSLYPSMGVERIAKRYNTSNAAIAQILRCDTYKHIDREPVKLNPPIKHPPIIREAAQALNDAGWSTVNIAKGLRISHNTASKFISSPMLTK